MLDAGMWKGEKWKGQKISTLAEVLSTVPDHGKLIVEIKSDTRILDTLKKDIEETV